VTTPTRAATPVGGEPWPRRSTQRMAVAVVEDLVDRIVSAEFPAGSPLPNEAGLCEKYGVSRTVVREAVQSVEAMHLVRAQQGQGTIVRPLDDWDLLNPMVLSATVRHDVELAILEDVIDMRRSLEAQMAAQAALRGTDAQLADVAAAFERLLGEVDDPIRYLQADLDFHDAIMIASGNRLSRAAIHTINAEAFRSLRYLGEPTPEDCRVSNVAHGKVREMVLARDPEGAARAMNDHIVGSWVRRRPRPPADPGVDALRGSPGVIVDATRE
jgi:GntR family galactonate operon transcriptional repressor